MSATSDAHSAMIAYAVGTSANETAITNRSSRIVEPRRNGSTYAERAVGRRSRHALPMYAIHEERQGGARHEMGPLREIPYVECHGADS